MTPPYPLCSCLWRTHKWKYQQKRNNWQIFTNQAEKAFIIMCFSLCNSVNRLSKAQKNGSRWMNSTILTLAVRRLHEGGVRKKTLRRRRRNGSGCNKTCYFSLYKTVKTLGKNICDLFRFLWLNSAYIFARLFNKCTSTIMDNVVGKWNIWNIQGIAK